MRWNKKKRREKRGRPCERDYNKRRKDRRGQSNKAEKKTEEEGKENTLETRGRVFSLVDATST
jgi:hypothetical protein